MNYREVKCSDRLPEQEKDNHGELLRFTIPYHLITGSNIRTVGYYDFELKQWFAEDYPEAAVEFWLEPYELPTEEEIHEICKKTMNEKYPEEAKSDSEFWSDVHKEAISDCVDGAKAITNLLER